MYPARNPSDSSNSSLSSNSKSLIAQDLRSYDRFPTDSDSSPVKVVKYQKTTPEPTKQASATATSSSASTSSSVNKHNRSAMIQIPARKPVKIETREPSHWTPIRKSNWSNTSGAPATRSVNKTQTQEERNQQWLNDRKS